MSEPFLSEIKIVSFGFPPKGWCLCNGQLLPINQNQALFSLLRTTYGGDGRVNFGPPNLQGNAPMHMGNSRTWGERGGEQNHTLNISEIPAHTHTPVGSSTNPPTSTSAAGNLWAPNNSNPYAGTGDGTAMNPACIQAAGGSQPHNN